MTTFAQSQHESGISAVFEDDGSVAYGYLLLDKEIVGEVWLYNHGRAQDEFHPVRGEAPANPLPFAKDVVFPPAQSEADVAFRWDETDDGVLSVVIRIRGVVAGLLRKGERLGWSAMAAQDGRLARALSDADGARLAKMTTRDRTRA